MFSPLFFADGKRPNRRRVPRDLAPHLMRDLGLDPWPQEPPRPWHLVW